MDVDPLELVMKASTLAGVVIASSTLLMARASPQARNRAFVLGSAGVALMFANALIAVNPFASLVDLGYLALASFAFVGARREGRVRAEEPLRSREPSPSASAGSADSPAVPLTRV